VGFVRQVTEYDKKGALKYIYIYFFSQNIVLHNTTYSPQVTSLGLSIQLATDLYNIESHTKNC
jgi:hypothetical protein